MSPRVVIACMFLGASLGAACGGRVVVDTVTADAGTGGEAGAANCGAATCDPAVDYCANDLIANAFTCTPLPPACVSDTSCACITTEVPQGPCVDFNCDTDAGIRTLHCASG